MTSSLSRLVLCLLATVTLALSSGGALGLWPTGAPASGWAQQAEPSMRPAASRPALRDMEGLNGAVRHDDDSTDDAEGGGADDSADAGSSADAGGALPARSGTGRRVLFDISRQRVWLVGPAGHARRTYLVSGSRTDNLRPGRYEVYSRSRHAVSYTYEETMGYMVRFAHGENAAIGFHDIPVDQQGHRVQTRAQLGNRLSSGCIRQARPDARALWDFAHVGTRVVVTP